MHRLKLLCRLNIRGAFNTFPDFFFVQAFRIVIDAWKFTMLLLYILWDDWPIFMISASNEQLQQQLECTILNPNCHSWWISQMQSGRDNTLEERYAIKFRFKLGKNATETYGMLQTAFGASCMNRASIFEWHKRFKEGRESVRDDEKCGRSKEVRTPELGLGLGILCWGFRKRFRWKRPALFKLGQWHFQQDTAPVHNSILVTDFLTKMGIKTFHQPPYSPDLAPCDFWLFPKLKEKLQEVVGTVPQVHCSRRRLLRSGLDFHVCTINNSAHTKKLWQLI